MASAVTVIFGANSTQFQAELARMQTLTKVAAARMAATSTVGNLHGSSGLIREAITIPREIIEGRGLGRVLGSLSLFIQYLSSASRSANQTASAARVLADAYAEASLNANMAATAALKKAEASAAAAEAEGFEIDATLVAADADAAESAAANGTAAALARKAAAADTDAAAQEALAASTGRAGISMLGITAIFAVVAFAAAIVYERVAGVKKLLDSLSFSGATDLKDDYIPLLKRHMNDARNAQKEVTDEVNKTLESYKAVEAAAGRQAESTKSHYEQLKKILEIHKQTDLDKLGPNATTAQKMAVEKKYSDQELQMQKDQQRAELVDKLTEKTNLEIESKNKLSQADSIHVATKEEDQKTLGQLNQNAEAAEKFMKGGGVWSEYKKQLAINLGGASEDLINQTEAGGQEAAQKAINDRNKFADKVDANDETRKTKDQLVKDAAKSAGAAAQIGASLPDVAKANAQKNSDSAEEAAAKLTEEKAKFDEESLRKERGGGFQLNAQQRLGAYAATPPGWPALLADVKGIRENSSHMVPNRNTAPGSQSPRFGGMQH